MAAEPRALTREDAQRRVDRIRAFREELTELEGLGVVALDAGQQERLRLFHEQAIASLAARFDVDASEAEKRLSLGMRVASLLGAMALAAAVYFFFYRFWGGLPTAAQVGLLALAPVLAVAGMEVAARRERTLYVTGILGLVAVAAFVIDLDVLGAVFNLRPSPGAFLAWSAFAGLLAYAYGLRLLLLAAVAGFTVFFSAQVASAMHCPWDAFGERPENLFLPAALLLAAAVAAVPRAAAIPAASPRLRPPRPLRRPVRRLRLGLGQLSPLAGGNRGGRLPAGELRPGRARHRGRRAPRLARGRDRRDRLPGAPPLRAVLRLVVGLPAPLALLPGDRRPVGGLLLALRRLRSARHPVPA